MQTENNETTTEQTTLERSQSFALSLAAAFTIENALKEAKELPKTMRREVEETIYKAILAAPSSFHAKA